MGCDGGTIPKRHELVKGPKKPIQVDKDANIMARWFHCALSQEKLCPPIVSCELGRLYNKECVLEYLLDKSQAKCGQRIAMHIRNLKDICELKLTENPAWLGGQMDRKGDKYEDLHAARFICPISGLEMNGKHRFCFLHGCKCVIAERALKEIKTETCPQCGAGFTKNQLIMLNGTVEEIEVLGQRMEERRMLNKQHKKSKKSKINGECPPQHADEAPSCSKRIIPEKEKTAEAVKTPAEEARPKTEVFKSLFTSHSSAKRPHTAHWITYNPYFN
uniref:replication termination factor 2 n=1 Tax=Myxine glutinosa TaxID=7769 RepID=UPI00358EC1A0